MAAPACDNHTMTGTLRWGVEVIKGRPVGVPVFEERGNNPGVLWGAVFPVGAMLSVYIPDLT